MQDRTEQDAQLVIGTQCVNGCGTVLTADNIGLVTLKGKFSGPLGVCTTCTSSMATSIPAGLAGGPDGPDAPV